MLCQWSPHSEAELSLSPMWSAIGTFQIERSHSAIITRHYHGIIRHQRKIIAPDWSAGDDVALSTAHASRRSSSRRVWPTGRCKLRCLYLPGDQVPTGRACGLRGSRPPPRSPDHQRLHNLIERPALWARRRISAVFEPPVPVKAAHAKGRRVIALAAQLREDRVRARRAQGHAEDPTAQLQLLAPKGAPCLLDLHRDFAQGSGVNLPISPLPPAPLTLHPPRIWVGLGREVNLSWPAEHGFAEGFHLAEHVV
jgi:hypothetical protein